MPERPPFDDRLTRARATDEFFVSRRGRSVAPKGALAKKKCSPRNSLQTSLRL